MTTTSDFSYRNLHLRLLAHETGLLSISAIPESDVLPSSASTETSVIQQTKQQLREYLDGKRMTFQLALDLRQGTDFQRRVWEALRQIPYGQTRTYGEIARAVGVPRGSRAVGMACHRNPLLIVTPCHRVIGADGTLTGFACGNALKRFLLELELSRNMF